MGLFDNYNFHPQDDGGAGVLPRSLGTPSSGADRLNDFVDHNRLMLMALGAGIAQGGIGNGLRLAAQLGAQQQLQGYTQQTDLRDYLFKLSQAERAQGNTERKIRLQEMESGLMPTDAVATDDATG